MDQPGPECQVANRGRHGGDPVEQGASDELNREAQAKQVQATRDDSLVLANGRLQAAHARVLGSLLTRHNPRHGSSGYGYAYYEYGTGQG